MHFQITAIDEDGKVTHVDFHAVTPKAPDHTELASLKTPQDFIQWCEKSKAHESYRDYLFETAFRPAYNNLIGRLNHKA